MSLYGMMQKNLFVIAGMNIIENEVSIMNTATELKRICEKLNILLIFKASFDKANRTSIQSYRGIGMERGLQILKKVKDELNLPIITDVHESQQCAIVAEVADIIQIPAFLCRQTDLLEAAAKTGKIMHIKKGQFCSSDVMLKCAEKIKKFGNDQIILCERGSFFGYNDLIVDSRNLELMRQDGNLVTMDMTHCLQQPAQKNADGTISAGGLRNSIPAMGRMAVAVGVHGIFMEVHADPDTAMCDAPTQWYLNQTESLLQDLIDIDKVTRPMWNKNSMLNKNSITNR